MICVIWHNSCTGDTLSFYQFFLHTCRCLSNLSLVNLLPCHYLLKKFSVTHQIKYKPLTLACKSFPDIAPICLLASSPPPLKKHSEVPPLAFVQSISLPAFSLFSPPVLYPFLTIHPKRLSSYESLLDFFSYETEIDQAALQGSLIHLGTRQGKEGKGTHGRTITRKVNTPFGLPGSLTSGIGRALTDTERPRRYLLCSLPGRWRPSSQFLPLEIRQTLSTPDRVPAKHAFHILKVIN